MPKRDTLPRYHASSVDRDTWMNRGRGKEFLPLSGRTRKSAIDVHCIFVRPDVYYETSNPGYYIPYLQCDEPRKLCCDESPLASLLQSGPNSRPQAKNLHGEGEGWGRVFLNQLQPFTIAVRGYPNFVDHHRTLKGHGSPCFCTCQVAPVAGRRRRGPFLRLLPFFFFFIFSSFLLFPTLR